MITGRQTIPRIVRLLVAVAVLWLLAGCSSAVSSDARSGVGSGSSGMDGVHWHIQLDIFIKGEHQTVPANVGIGPEYKSDPQFDPMMSMTGIHTHDESGMIHWEIMSKANGSSFALGTFFKTWGRPFSATRLFDQVNGPSGRLRMIVNGTPNAQFDQYQIHDDDRVEIRFE